VCDLAAHKNPEKRHFIEGSENMGATEYELVKFAAVLFFLKSTSDWLMQKCVSKF